MRKLNEQARTDLLQKEVRELRAWKESAMRHTPDWQKIAELLKLPLGSSVSNQILPAIEELAALRKKVGELRTVFIVCQGGLVQEVEGLRPEEYDVIDLDNFEDQSEYEMHEAWHRLSSVAQDYLQRHWYTEIPAFARDPDKMPKKEGS